LARALADARTITDTGSVADTWTIGNAGPVTDSWGARSIADPRTTCTGMWTWGWHLSWTVAAKKLGSSTTGNTACDGPSEITSGWKCAGPVPASDVQEVL
jgi:hypothetical protein